MIDGGNARKAAQFDEVLARDDDERRAERARGANRGFDLRRHVPVVVPLEARPDDRRAQVREHRRERRGIADPRPGEDRRAAKRREGHVGPIGRPDQRTGARAYGRPKRARGERRDAEVEGRERPGRHALGARHDDRVRPREPLDRLAQEAARQETPVAEGIRCIEQHDVHVAVEAAVLKPVIEQQEVDVGPLGEESSPPPHPIRVLRERHGVAEKILEHEPFVRERLARGLRSIAPREHRRTSAACERLGGEPRDKGRLARTARRQVAHANDGNREARGNEPALERPKAPACDEAVRDRERTEPETRGSAEEPATARLDRREVHRGACYRKAAREGDDRTRAART